MEPRIQYAKTADGVSIAFWTLGEGMPLVSMPPVTSHIHLEWGLEEFRLWYTRLGRKRKLVRYDGRGSGMSDRRTSDYSLEARVLELEAVVDQLGLTKFALLGVAHSGPAAITYTVRRPERVSHLLLWSTFARGSDNWDSKRARAIRDMRGMDWELYLENMVEHGLGCADPKQRGRFAAYLGECQTQAEARAAMAAISKVDVTDLLPKVTVPTLVLHRRQIPAPDLKVAAQLSSLIPGARLALLEGSSLAPYFGDTEAVAIAIDEFLAGGKPTATAVEGTAPSGLRTIMFTDVEGYTTLTERLGDAKARQVMRVQEHIVREALKAHGGLEIKTIGDAFMVSFSSVAQALECAIAIQTEVAIHDQSAEEPFKVRIGLNAGEPIADDNDFFGTTVNMAARVADQARGGEILVSDVVRQLAAGKAFLFLDRGEAELRGFADTVHLYELRWRQPE